MQTDFDHRHREGRGQRASDLIGEGRVLRRRDLGRLRHRRGFVERYGIVDWTVRDDERSDDADNHRGCARDAHPGFWTKEPFRPTVAGSSRTGVRWRPPVRAVSGGFLVPARALS